MKFSKYLILSLIMSFMAFSQVNAFNYVGAYSDEISRQVTGVLQSNNMPAVTLPEVTGVLEPDVSTLLFCKAPVPKDKYSQLWRKASPEQIDIDYDSDLSKEALLKLAKEEGLPEQILSSAEASEVSYAFIIKQGVEVKRLLEVLKLSNDNLYISAYDSFLKDPEIFIKPGFESTLRKFVFAFMNKDLTRKDFEKIFNVMLDKKGNLVLISDLLKLSTLLCIKFTEKQVEEFTEILLTEEYLKGNNKASAFLDLILLKASIGKEFFLQDNRDEAIKVTVDEKFYNAFKKYLDQIGLENYKGFGDGNPPYDILLSELKEQLLKNAKTGKVVKEPLYEVHFSMDYYNDLMRNFGGK